MQTMVDTIILRFKKKITSTNEKSVWDAVFKLTNLENANFVCLGSAKKNVDVSYIDATAKVKQLKSDIEFASKVRPDAKFIPISTLELNIFLTLGNVMGLN